jgi:hypothetical protein
LQNFKNWVVNSISKVVLFLSIIDSILFLQLLSLHADSSPFAFGNGCGTGSTTEGYRNI